MTMYQNWLAASRVMSREMLAASQIVKRYEIEKRRRQKAEDVAQRKTTELHELRLYAQRLGISLCGFRKHLAAKANTNEPSRT